MPRLAVPSFSTLACPQPPHRYLDRQPLFQRVRQGRRPSLGRIASSDYEIGVTQQQESPGHLVAPATHAALEGTDAHGIQCSMSRKANCWDNAVVESFFGTLKVELDAKDHWASRAEARYDVFEYIEVFYNRQRRHSYLGYVSPERFETEAAETTVSMSGGDAA